MAKRQMNGRSPKGLLLGLLGLTGAGALMILLLFLRPGLPSSPPSTVEATLPPPPENPYTEADFYTDDGFVHCSAIPAKTGIDVSSHQEEIDWAAVAASGVDYAMIRVGYRGYDQGGLHMDAYAEANLQGALDAGLPVGVYFYSQAISVEEAREEAAMVLEFIRDWNITYPVVFDWEWVGADARTAGVSSRTVTDCTLAFCQMVQEAGYKPAFYFNLDLAQNTFRLRELQDFDFWLAQYQDAMTFAYDVDMWQYSCTGRVAGITGDVDLNLCFKSYE